MKRAKIILDRNHPFWKEFPPDSPIVQGLLQYDMIWGPLFNPVPPELNTETVP